MNFRDADNLNKAGAEFKAAKRRDSKGDIGVILARGK